MQSGILCVAGLRPYDVDQGSENKLASWRAFIAALNLGTAELIRHCEERSDVAISKQLILHYEIAALRSQ
jgi:primase-polymerase (primpol)-like protein